jgi:hypothetical protein
MKVIGETKKGPQYQDKTAPVSFQLVLSGADGLRLMKSVCGSFTYLQ